MFQKKRHIADIVERLLLSVEQKQSLVGKIGVPVIHFLEHPVHTRRGEGIRERQQRLVAVFRIVVTLGRAVNVLFDICIYFHHASSDTCLLQAILLSVVD